MTFKEAYTSLLNLYKKLMFPESPYKTGWTMSQIDEMDVHFFDEMFSVEAPQQKVYIDQVWA